MIRLSSLLAAVISLVLAPPLSSDEGEARPRPVRPRSGAVFKYRKSPPSIKLGWNVPGPVGNYVVQIERKSDSNTEVATFVVKQQNSFSFQPQQEGRYRWWVAVLGPDGEPGRPGPARYFVVVPGTRWSEARSLSVVPQAPRLALPADGMSSQFRGQTASVKLSWEKVPQAEAYLVEVTSKGQKVGGPGSTKDTHFTVKNLPAGQYSWSVRAVDSSGTRSEASPYRIFVLVQEKLPADASQTGKITREQPEFPTAPKLQAPKDGARILADAPTKVLLFWEPLSGASAYEVVVAASEDFSSVVIRRELTGSMMSLPKPPRGESFWRVRGVDSDGRPGEWSATWKFTYQQQSLWED